MRRAISNSRKNTQGLSMNQDAYEQDWGGKA